MLLSDRGNTWNNIASIHRVFVLDEAKAVHELDFLDSTSSMRTEMILDILLCDWKGRQESATRESLELMMGKPRAGTGTGTEEEFTMGGSSGFSAPREPEGRLSYCCEEDCPDKDE